MDSRTGEGTSGSGVHVPASPHRRRMDARSVPPHAQGWGDGHRRRNGCRLREGDLEAKLEDLLGRMKSGRYFASPVRRHYIPKADGTKRPLGIPTFEDKVAQRENPDAAGADLRDGLSPVLLRLPAQAVGSRCPQRTSRGHHRAAPTVGDRRGFEVLLRLELAHSLAVIPRPADSRTAS